MGGRLFWPSLSLVPGGGFLRGGCPTCRAGEGGSNPTYLAQNDPHVAPTILTTYMWGKKCWWKKPKFVFRRLRRQHSQLHKIKDPARKPISPSPHPPPPFARQFSGRRARTRVQPPGRSQTRDRHDWGAAANTVRPLGAAGGTADIRPLNRPNAERGRHGSVQTQGRAEASRSSLRLVRDVHFGPIHAGERGGGD